jgi:hypothetical protein
MFHGSVPFVVMAPYGAEFNHFLVLWVLLCAAIGPALPL